jgi:hypothetical protein
MKKQIFTCLITFVSFVVFLSSCAPLATPASSSNFSPGNTASTSNTDWQEFLTVEPWVGCTPRVSPIAIDPNGNTAEQIDSTNPIATVRINWPIVPFQLNSVLFTLTSTADADWIEIDKSLDVTVVTNSSIPQHVDVIELSGCGGTQQIRDFPETNLRTDLSSFTQKSTFSGADFFTLQPGEFEKFNVPFLCDAPGHYIISVDANYIFQGENGTIDFPEFDALCPESFTIYNTDGSGYLFGVETYTWGNGEYIQTP